MESFIQKLRAKIPRDARILCALSGGADSTAMTAALVALRAELGLTLAAAHYHHGLRGAEADQDLLFCQQLCQAWNIPLYAGRGDVASLSGSKASRGTEADGRRLRYAFLECAARGHNMNYIATAHNAGDNAETILLNLIRGAGLDGLTGIPFQRSLDHCPLSIVHCPLSILRPMLDCTRAEALAYLSQQGLSYCGDTSNDGDSYRRNRLRHGVMPLLAAENPAIGQTLRRTAALLRADAEYLNALTARELENMKSAFAQKPRPYRAELFDPLDSRVCVRVEAAALAALPPPLAGRAVRLMAAEAAGSPAFPDLSQKHIEAVLAACRQEGAVAASLPRGLTAAREYDAVCVYAGGQKAGFAPVTLRFGEAAELSELGLRAAWQKKPTFVHNLVYHFPLYSDTMKSTMRIRPRAPGDKLPFMTRGGARGGSHSLQDLFVDTKLPRRLRGLVPVAEVGGKPAGVFGFGGAQPQPEVSGGGEWLAFYKR